jgi:hypothetical protein
MFLADDDVSTCGLCRILVAMAKTLFLSSWRILDLEPHGCSGILSRRRPRYSVDRRLLRWHRAHAAAIAAHRSAEIAARAELQHRWVVASDSRGTYGRYPPATGLPVEG